MKTSQFVSYVVVVVVVCVLCGYFGRYYERMVGRGGDSDCFRDEEVGDDYEGDREEEMQITCGLCRSF